MFQHELHVHRQRIEMLAHLVAQTFDARQSCRIFLGGDDALGRRHGGKGLVDAKHVLLLEVVMVGKGHRRKSLAECLALGNEGGQVFNNLLWRGDARQEQHMLVGLQARKRARTIIIYMPQTLILKRGEVEVLIGEEVHRLSDDPEVHGPEGRRTLGHDNDVGPVLSRQRLAQSAGRQQLVVDDQAVVVDQQDVDARLYVAMLEGIVEQDDVETAVLFGQYLYAVHAFHVHRYDGVGILPLHLERLVANVAHGAVLVGDDESLRLSLIAPAEHGNL